MEMSDSGTTTAAVAGAEAQAPIVRKVRILICNQCPLNDQMQE